jgi:uncharacterized phage-associated protein
VDLLDFVDIVQLRNMATVLDVAAYILHKKGQMTSWKLQKLVYYAQAWSLVWDERPMFRQRIEAWANGPVCPALYRQHQGLFLIRDIVGGDSGKLNEDARDTVNAVLDYYGDMHAQELSDLTHSEAPWKDARGDLPASAPSQREITHEAMAAYYEALPAA